MRVLAPDPSNRIDLPGVGPTPRPVDVDAAKTGFSALATLRVYDFAPGLPIDGEAEEDEVLVVLLAGGASFAVTGGHAATFDLGPGEARGAFLPPLHHYRLTPGAEGATVAYARARPLRAPEEAAPPAALVAAGATLSADGPAERLRLRLLPLSPDADASADLGVRAERLVHLTGPATVRTESETEVLDARFTVALDPGEGASVKGEGLMLLVGARLP